jgi:[protein-PII] uridylyltransferase
VTEVVVNPPPSPEQVHRTLKAWTEEVEGKVRDAYARAFGARKVGGVAIAAVGGFGRKELFPHSDVDLLLLVASDKTMPPKEAISEFLQILWDSKLRPSHSVHTIDECTAEQTDNAEFTISLLDRRFLIGDQGIYDTLQKNFTIFLKKRAVLIANQIAALAEGRRSKYQNTIYHLEPNIKESPGGFRDLQTIRWLMAVEPQDNLPDLKPAFDFLAGMRIRLHERSGRDQNTLTFELQDSLSADPGELMRAYYRHARVVDRTVRQAIEIATDKKDSLLGRFHDWRSRLSTTNFTVSRERVLLRNAQPPPDLSLFEFVARHGLRLAPRTSERLNGFVPTAKWDDWKRLLSLPHASAGLRAMQDSGALAAALPEWTNIECAVVRDFYHRYTVDEHTLVAIDSLEMITDGRFKELLKEIEHPALVRFALLLHDIGKGSGRDHSTEAVEIAARVLGRMGAPKEELEAIQLLVRDHLVLSSVMTSRDLHDSSTAKQLADSVGTLEQLKMLAVLTYADISAVNPQAMTPWRLEQLWRVYVLVHEELTRELESSRIHDTSGAGSERAQFLEGLPTRYLRTHSPAELDAHVQLARQLETRPVAVEIEHARGVYKLTLLTKDKPGLFAGVSAAISSFGLNIVKVEAFANATGVVVDTFTFSDPHRTLELNPTEVDRLRGVVRRVVEGKLDADKLLRGRPKPLVPGKARLAPRIAFNNDASQAATLVEIVAEDRPGLLYDLAHTISVADCNIEVVLIDTEAHKALDVFYLTSAGKKLTTEQQEQLKTALTEACALK